MRQQVSALLPALPLLLTYLLGLLTARLALAAPAAQIQVTANCTAPNYCASTCPCGSTGLFCAGSILCCQPCPTKTPTPRPTPRGLLPALRPAHRQGLPLPRRSVPHPTTALTPVLAAPQAPLAAGVSCVACPARPTPQLLRPAARLPLHQHSRPRAHQRRPGIDGTQAMGDPGPTV